MFKYKTNFTLEDNSSDYLKISWAGESFQSQFVIFMENLSFQNINKKKEKKEKKTKNQLIWRVWLSRHVTSPSNHFHIWLEAQFIPKER